MNRNSGAFDWTTSEGVNRITKWILDGGVTGIKSGRNPSSIDGRGDKLGPKGTVNMNAKNGTIFTNMCIPFDATWAFPTGKVALNGHKIADCRL